jgi:fission 1 protein/division protein 1
MDEVAVGEEVTELPCKHWFHHQCVSAWLAEHDTCPHCRQSISKHEEGEANPAPPPGGQASAGAQSTGSRTMPGAFEDVSGEGTTHDPYMVRSDAGSAEPANNQSGTTNTQAEGGATDQTHRGWFGPQS